MVLTRSLAAPLVAAVLLVPLAARRLRSRLVPLAAGVLLAVAVAVVALRHDLGNLEPIRLRWVNWQTTAWVFGQHPWLGVGLGGVGQAGLLAPTAAANITPYAHNTYLQLLAELGLAGAGLLAAGVWALLRLIRSGLTAHPGLALAVATIPLHNLVDFSAYAPEVLLPWAVLAGTLAGRCLPLPERPLRGGVVLALVGGGALLSTLAWRGEVELAAAATSPSARAVESALAAARWAPWAVDAGGVRGRPRPRERRARRRSSRAWTRSWPRGPGCGRTRRAGRRAAAGCCWPRGAAARRWCGRGRRAGGRRGARVWRSWRPRARAPAEAPSRAAGSGGARLGAGPERGGALAVGLGGDGCGGRPGSASPEPEGARPDRPAGVAGGAPGLGRTRRSAPARRHRATRRACSRPAWWPLGLVVVTGTPRGGGLGATGGGRPRARARRPG